MILRTIKEIITGKVAWLIIGVVVYYLVINIVKYKLDNIIINSILLYLYSGVFSVVFSLSVLDLYLDNKGNVLDETSEEFTAQELELRLKYPKLFIYNRMILYLQLLIKFIALIMFIYGMAKYYL